MPQLNKVTQYETEIYKNANSENLSFKLSEKALGKNTKTKSVTDDILHGYQKKQIDTINKINLKF